MKVILGFMVLVFCAPSKGTNSKSVNVAFETSLLFEPGEEKNFSFIDKIRRFIDQIEKAITPVKAFLRTNDDKNKIFSKFLEKICVAILKYEDGDLKELVRVLADEVENDFDRNEIFSENAQTSILSVLIGYSNMKAKEIRSRLQYALNNGDAVLKRLVDKLNEYCNETDAAKLEAVTEICDDPSERDNVKKTVKNFLKILSDKYENFNKSIKNDVDKEIRMLFKYINMDEFKQHTVKIIPTVKSEEIKETSTISYKHSRSHDEKPLIINKNVEVFVRGTTDDQLDGDLSKENLNALNKLDSENLESSAVNDDEDDN